VGHLCFGYCFDSKVGTRAPPVLKAPHSQSNLKSPQTLATANFLTQFIISIAVLENVPLTHGYRKEPLFHTKRRSAGTGNRTRATCMAGSVTRLSAIHYAAPCSSEGDKTDGPKLKTVIYAILTSTKSNFQLQLCASRNLFFSCTPHGGNIEKKSAKPCEENK
jgi:hypothetical protein